MRARPASHHAARRRSDARRVPPAVFFEVVDGTSYGDAGAEEAALIALVAGLTIYSIVVTLQKSNEEYGGWTPRDEEDVGLAARGDVQRMGSGARYDPVTDQWTYPTPEEKAATTAKVGRAPAAAGAAADSDSNRYERRMLKKRKREEKRRKKRR